MLHGITSYSSDVILSGIERLVKVVSDMDGLTDGIDGGLDKVSCDGLNTELIEDFVVSYILEALSSRALVILDKVLELALGLAAPAAAASAAVAALAASIASDIDELVDDGLVIVSVEGGDILLIIIYIYILVFSKVYIMSNNISDSLVNSNGDAKMNYTMYYNTEFVTAIHNTDNITISYEINTNSKSAMYNNVIYNVTTLMIVHPSVHSFNGNTGIQGEIIIKHTNGSQKLNVCIPINTKPTNSLSGSNIVAKIIDAVSAEAPTENNIAQGIDEFSIMDIIPKSTYFSYIAINGDTNIVFGIENGIYLTKNTINKLISMLDTYNANSEYNYNSDLFKSTNNPINGLIGDDIYIDCTPTGYGEDETVLVNNKGHVESPPTLFTPNIIYNLSQLLTAFLLIVILFFIAGVYMYGMDVPSIISNAIQ